MACFDSLNADSFTLRGDVQLKGDNFRGLFGWHGANPSLQRGLSEVEREQAARQVDLPRPPPVRVVRRVAVQRPQKPDWVALKAKLQQDGKLRFRRVQGKLVAPVLDVVKERLVSTRKPGKARVNFSLKRKVDEALDRHDRWRKDVDIFKAPRSDGKPGGSEEWLRVERFLQDLYADLP